MTSQSTRPSPNRSPVPLAAYCALLATRFLTFLKKVGSPGVDTKVATQQRISGIGLGQTAVMMGFHPTHGV
jgi:hypothetical protein